MKVLVTGPLKGSATRLKGLIEVSKPELVFVVGPLGVEKPLNLDTSWFFVRGPGDNLKVLSRSGGVELFSRIFRFKNTLYFSGISGVFHPSTFRFTRREWIKARGKIDKKSVNYIFKEDIDELLVAFKNSGLKRLDILLLADSPFKAVFKEVLDVTKPRFVFYPSPDYRKEKSEDTTFVGLEDVTSTKGKYIIHI